MHTLLSFPLSLSEFFHTNRQSAIKGKSRAILRVLRATKNAAKKGSLVVFRRVAPTCIYRERDTHTLTTTTIRLHPCMHAYCVFMCCSRVRIGATWRPVEISLQWQQFVLRYVDGGQVLVRYTYTCRRFVHNRGYETREISRPKIQGVSQRVRVHAYKRSSKRISS